MKILYHHRTGSRDGQAVHIDGLVGALRAAGHAVVVVGPSTTAHTRFGAEAGPVARARRLLPSAASEVLELLYNVVAFVRLMRSFRRHRPDVIYERHNLFLLAGIWLRKLTGAPLLLEVNAPLFEERSRYGPLALKAGARWSERLAWRTADCILPVTRVLADQIMEAGVDEERVAVIANGVAAEFLDEVPDTMNLRRELGIDDRMVLGFAGFMRDWHGLDLVIDVLARRGEELNLHLVVVGDGPARIALESQAAARGVAARTTFAGVVERNEIRRYLASFDIALQPRAVSYASPLKLVEYMALGRAIVAPDQPNIREVLSNGRTARLFDPATLAALEAAVVELADDRQLRARLGEAARAALIAQGLTWSANAARVARLAEEAIAKSDRRPRPVADETTTRRAGGGA